MLETNKSCRPLLVRGHQAACQEPYVCNCGFQVLLILSITSWQSAFPVLSNPAGRSCQFANLVSAFNGLQVSNLVFGNCLLDPRTIPLPSPGCVISTWGLPGYPGKIIKFQACLQGPQKSQKVSPRQPEDYNMIPQALPQDT